MDIDSRAGDIASERPAKRPRVSEASPEERAPVSTSDTKVAAQSDEDDEEEEDNTPYDQPGTTRASDLYLDTVNRAALDFDFEKLCSVSLSNINIYGCLVCGKYYQGRGRSSNAYAHSIHDDHHVFINLETKMVYVLPDGYPVSDPSLDDISAVLDPKFTRSQVAALSDPSHIAKPSFDLASKPYVPGYIGLNNIKANDYLNVVIHSLLHVPPLRDHLLLAEFGEKVPELLRRFAGLAKKLWNPRLFKAQVSPHEFLQEVGRASSGKFKITEQGDPVEFLGWLLNRLHRDMGGSKKRNSSVIYSTFQGTVRVDTQQFTAKPGSESHERSHLDTNQDVKSVQSPFLFLALDLPPPPLFQDAVEKNILPQVTLSSVLAKYDGKTVQESPGQVKRFRCTRLPPYIILHYKRFTKNNFLGEDKNPTIVNFPVRGQDFRDVLEDAPVGVSTVYDLVANITLDSTAGTTRDRLNTAWKVHLRAGHAGSPTSSSSGTGQEEGERWYMVQDLIIEDIAKEMIFLGETILQIWERRT